MVTGAVVVAVAAGAMAGGEVVVGIVVDVTVGVMICAGLEQLVS